ncbi:class V aminotransferase [Deltaproteobacteria bacterium]|nr:class V aminotransferase [Deltaproteobacteria bacterium]
MQTNKEQRLYTPGPVTVPHRVRAAAALPMIHHRSPEFHAVYASCIENMQWLLGTKQDVLLAHTSGRGAMEACITNLLCKGDAAATVVNGNFGVMFAKIAKAYGVTTHPVLADWTRPFAGEAAAAELAAVLKANPGIKAVTICHNDTANSVENDIRLAASVAHEQGAMLFVDGVSSVGCALLEFDEWGIDALATASQKGLMSPAGVSFVALSDRAWEAAGRSDLPRYFTDFTAIRNKFHEKAGAPETPGSTPVLQVRCVAEALSMIREEGRAEVFARHERLAAAIRAGLTAMNLEIVPANAQRPSKSVTTFLLPSGVNGAAVRSALLDDFGIRIAGGLGEYKDSTLRIGHMGYFFDADALCVISALEAALFRLGVLFEPGRGIAACMKAL